MKKLLAILLLVPTLVCAWEPSKPITVLVGSAPGSNIELNFRTAAAVVTKNNPNANFVIVTKPGADGVVAGNQLLTSTPDGYTISAVSTMSTFVTQDVFQRDQKKFKYDSFITPLIVSKSPLCIIANTNSNTRTPRDFINKLKTTTTPVNIAVGGGPHRLAFEMLMDKVPGNAALVKSIAYQGPLPAVTAVASNDNVEFGIVPITVAKPLIDAGKVRLIALTGGEVFAPMPDILLMKDYVPGFVVYAGTTLALPPNTPKEIVDWYVTNFSSAIKSKEAKELYKTNLMSYNNSTLTPNGVNTYVSELRKTWHTYIVGEKKTY